MSIHPAIIRGQEDSCRKCPLCVLERPNNSNKIFKNYKAISNHLRISHDLSNEDYCRIRDAVRENGKMGGVDFTNFRGLIR